MTTLTLTLPKPHKAQQVVLAGATRFNVVDCGRRWGKSLLGVERVTHPALKGYPVAWFAPSYKMLSDSWRLAKHILQPAIKNKSETEKRIELITGGVIDFWSLDNSDAGRGKKYKRVVVDEAAMVAKLEEAWLGSIRPTLSDFVGDAYFFSTPKGHNYFKRLWDMGNSPSHPDWQCWQMPTKANPYIRDSEIEAARLELPDRTFRQEYMAEFIDDAGVFRNVLGCAKAKPQTEPLQGHNYVFGVDWGKHEDFTVISVIDTTTNELVLMARFNQIDYVYQRRKLGDLYEIFRPKVILAERNAMGEPIIEMVEREGLPVRGFNTTRASKAEIIQDLQLAFEREALMILDDPVLISELQAYEIKPGGSDTTLPSYGAPSGFHDDTVISLALAWAAKGHNVKITRSDNPFY